MNLAVAAATLAVLTTACGGSDDNSEGDSVPWGARTCSDWVGRMDDTDRWDAAEMLLTAAKGLDNDTDGAPPSSTGAIKRFAADLGAECERGASDDLLGRLAPELYQSRPAIYSI
ncbi:hypothetical protein ABZT26_25980 [Streptomyces sp. NPDC005395]|uniref:hypothetical protein n=1 Tax=Streptomyces sp. NPDC005395 TaxID=3157042 RepID=UPI0033A806AD